MGVPGPIRQALLRIELAVRGAQPAQADRRARIVRAVEGDLVAVRANTRSARKTSASLVSEEKSFAATGPVISIDSCSVISKSEPLALRSYGSEWKRRARCDRGSSGRG